MVEETEGGHVWVVDQLVLEQVCCGLMVLLFGVVWMELGCSSPVYHSKLWIGFVSDLSLSGHVGMWCTPTPSLRGASCWARWPGLHLMV